MEYNISIYNNSNEKINYKLYISNDIISRFENEGIIQLVRLYNYDTILYETTFGCDIANNYFNKIQLDELEYLLEDDYNINELTFFKNWIINQLKPIQEKRIEKIDIIKNKMNNI